MIQKLLLSILALSCLFWMVYAGETSSTSSWSSSEFSAIQEYYFDFKAIPDGGKIKLSWIAFPEGKDFKWYKLAYSTTKENPSYPEDTSYFLGDKREQTTGEFWTKEKMIYVRLCAITSTNERFCSGSRKVTLSQETVKTETPTVCTMEYTPVCGKKEGVYKTYSNKCMLNAEKATYLSQGECGTSTNASGSTLVCTKEYIPVCGKKEDSYKLYPNNCLRENAGAWKAEMKYCEKSSEIPRPVNGSWAFSTGSMNPNMQSIFKKADSIIESFIKKLEEKDYSDEKIAQILGEVSTKLDTLKSQEKYKVLIPYMQKRLAEAKAKYENNFSDLEKIFWEY